MPTVGEVLTEANTPPFFTEGERVLAAGRTTPRYAFVMGVTSPMSVVLGLSVGFLLVRALALAYPREQVRAVAADPLVMHVFLFAMLVMILWFLAPWAVVEWLRLRKERYCVTTQHVYTWRCAWSTRVDVLPLARVTDVQVQQTVRERITGGWTVVVGSDGGSVSLVGVENPKELRLLLLQAMGHEVTDTPMRPKVVRVPVTSPPVWEGRALKRGLVPLWLQIVPTFYVAADGSLLEVFGWGAWIPFARVVAGVLAFAMLGAMLSVLRAWYAVHEDRVVRRSGLLGRVQHELYFDAVADIRLHRSFWGRLLGYGTVEVVSSSGDEVGIDRVRDADHVRALVDAYRQARILPTSVSEEVQGVEPVAGVVA